MTHISRTIIDPSDHDGRRQSTRAIEVGMDGIALAQRYFDAWNAHDGDAIAATFADGGTYSDSTVGTLDARATAQYANGLFASFPDLTFDLSPIGLSGDGLVAAQWLMRGTNTAAFQGLPPTGREIAVPGADFIRLGAPGIESVQGYFDTRVLPEQLGLDVIVQPSAIGPFAFGTSAYATNGNGNVPGAFSLTVLEARSEDEEPEVKERSRAIVQELLAMPGFISWIGAVIGNRLYTITAWESADAVKQLRNSAAHTDAMRRFWGPDLAKGGQTGVWTVDHLNGRKVRCGGCGAMVAAAEICRCGEPLPAAPAWW
jgi:steroid delta-isomerase-like uncharacterized protein